MTIHIHGPDARRLQGAPQILPQADLLRLDILRRGVDGSLYLVARESEVFLQQPLLIAEQVAAIDLAGEGEHPLPRRPADGTQADAPHPRQVLVFVEVDGVVQATLPRLQLQGVHIIVAVVAEAPAEGDIGVRVLQRREVLAADPAGLPGIPPRHGVPEERRAEGVDVVSQVALPLLREQRPVRHGATPGEEIHEDPPGGKPSDDPVDDGVLAALVGHPVPILHKPRSLRR